MLNLFQKTLKLALLVGIAGTVGVSSGCQETAAVATAASVAQTTAATLDKIPGWVQQLADSMQTQRKLNWGKPEHVLVTDTNYVFMYPTTKAELRKNQGMPRMIIIPRSQDPALSL